MSEEKKEKRHEQLVAKFEELAKAPLEDQMELFLKSFIFTLGDNWKEVSQLGKLYRKRLSDANEGLDDLNPVMAADFLQKNGRERTALQRKEEVADIDLDNNGRIAFIEYLLLHYKVMVLESYFQRVEEDCPYDLSAGGIGVTGVGPILLDELFTMPVGLDPQLEAAIEEFMQKKKEKQAHLKELEDKASKGGVKGLAATNEIKQIEAADVTEENRMEITLQAAKRRAAKGSGEEALRKKKEQEEAEKKKAAEESRNKLKARAAMFDAK